ncbi:hypothetical protein N9C31_04640 [Gammaproteobacteria bacterium]|nr:hypothetical protein [Gammaproteobacteria bacterium]
MHEKHIDIMKRVGLGLLDPTGSTPNNFLAQTSTGIIKVMQFFSTSNPEIYNHYDPSIPMPLPKVLQRLRGQFEKKVKEELARDHSPSTR